MLAACLAMLMLPLAACGQRDGREANGQYRYQTQFLGVFDTVSSVIGLADSEEQFQGYAQTMKEELTYYHELFDIYNDYEGVNNIKTINDNAGVAPVKVEQPILDLLEQSIWANEVSGGAVNTALGPVLKIWHDYREYGINNPESAELPPMDLLEEADKHTDLGLLQIDQEQMTVFLPEVGMRMDVGSGAKGFAAERVARLLEEAGLEHALISLGGNVRAIGFRDGVETPWRVGIRDPQSEDASDYVIKLDAANLAIVTSGVYERYYVVDGERYHHIIDPDSLMPEQTFDSVTIVCPDSGLADALTTALYNLSIEDGKAVLEAIPGAGAIWISGEDITWTQGIDELISE